MKLFSNRNKKLHFDFTEEFTEDFYEIENDFLLTEIAGGPITRRVNDEFEEMSVLENFTF